MSVLREHLRTLRNQHHDARYPGDLASELLGPASSLPRVLLRSAVAGAAIAAVVLMVIRIFLAPVHVQPETVVQTEPQPLELSMLLAGWEIPRLPDDFTFAPETPSFAFPTPSLPSFNELQPLNLTAEEAT